VEWIAIYVLSESWVIMSAPSNPGLVASACDVGHRKGKSFVSPVRAFSFRLGRRNQILQRTKSNGNRAALAEESSQKSIQTPDYKGPNAGLGRTFCLLKSRILVMPEKYSRAMEPPRAAAVREDSDTKSEFVAR
jgi:hypothetical protein